MWRNWKSCTLLVGTRNGEAAMKTVWSFLKKLKVELPCDPAILLLGIYPKEAKTLTQKDIDNSGFVTALFTKAET